jgi:shikimate 5-dehydrogenase
VDAGADVVVFNRTAQRAQELVDLVTQHSAPQRSGSASVGDVVMLNSERFAVYINCTSIGMEGGPMPTESPIDVLAGSAVTLDGDAVVLDTVYAPRRTVLLQQAEKVGATVIDGWGMFTRQAAMQFELWTGPASRAL